MRTRSTPAPRLPLLAAMARDLDERGNLDRATATKMWAAYTAHATITAWALARSDRQLPIRASVARPLGLGAAATGLALSIAGMSRFSGGGQLEGTRTQALTSTGVYRWTRNPQYLGYLLALSGAALTRRSLTAAALAGAIGVAYASWIPVEEHQLTNLYGQAYRDYTAHTHRWWGRTARNP